MADRLLSAAEGRLDGTVDEKVSSSRAASDAFQIQPMDGVLAVAARSGAGGIAWSSLSHVVGAIQFGGRVSESIDSQVLMAMTS